MARVSVIIPTYNRAGLVVEAVESVAHQTYEDFEIIVVDDGSTDDTRKLLLDQEGRISNKLKYIYQPNRGRSAARNRGIEVSGGEFIAFLDSDDLYLPRKLAEQVRSLDENPDCAMVFCHYVIKDVRTNKTLSKATPPKVLSGNIYPALLSIENNIITTPGVMLRRSILTETNGFDEKLHICEDLDLWRRVARVAEVCQISEQLVVIRYGVSEQNDLREFIRGRSRYYNKAIMEDTSLRRIETVLFADMYLRYAVLGWKRRNHGDALYSLLHLLKRPLGAAVVLRREAKRKVYTWLGMDRVATMAE